MISNDIQYGASSISEIRRLGALYVDKTERIYDLITGKNRRLFLSRPRRFGKTLLIDTLSEIFQGNRELFSGLAIDNKNYDWKPYPVIRLSLLNICDNTPEELNANLRELIKTTARIFRYDVKWRNSQQASKYLEDLFLYFIERNEKVVVLIDEYDYPLISNMSLPNQKLLDLLEVMRSFYSTLKLYSNTLQFLFLTGVTRIAYTSIFSGMNDLYDMSLDSRYTDLLGYTQEELEFNFNTQIDTLSSSTKMSRESFLEEVKKWYDGYRFSDSNLSVYNPSDINLFFQGGKFTTYWIDTGTPTFLVDILSKLNKFDILEYLSTPKDFSFFKGILKLDQLTEKNNVLRLLYQSGYLTIVGETPDGRYYLGFPNTQVDISFTSYLAESIWSKDYDYFADYKDVGLALVDGRVDDFISGIDSLFNSISKTSQKYHENTIEIVISLILKMTGRCKISNQLRSGEGITDIVVETDSTIYIIELKMDSKAQVCLSQIKNKNYPAIFKTNKQYHGLKIIGIGLCFSSSNCTLIDKIFTEL